MRIFFTSTLLLIILFIPVNAQRKHSSKRPAALPEIGKTAVVVDEKLSVLRVSPSLFAESIHRMQRGRTVRIQDVKQADGVTFYKVVVPPANFGWVQSDAVFGTFRKDDDIRLSELVTATTGFDQIEITKQFLDLYPSSFLRPGMLLLYGDLLEIAAAKLSKDANSRLKRAEITATGAPVHSYFLNFNMLDRYRKEGVIFLFNPRTRAYHYVGTTWQEVVKKFPDSKEAVEARRRLESLTAKMAATVSN